MREATQQLKKTAGELLPNADPDVHNTFAGTAGQIKDARTQFIKNRARAEKFIFIIDKTEELDPKSNPVMSCCRQVLTLV